MPSTLTVTQSATIKAIVNLFETGEVLGDYGQVTLIAGDTGHLTFGRSQTTLGSGNLDLLLQEYCGNAGARFGRRLTEALPQAKAKDTALDGDLKLHNVLRASADDPVMRDVQDTFFDKTYFDPAMKTAEGARIFTPLGKAVVYDSRVHGAWKLVRDRVDGTPETVGEREWIHRYVEARRSWLATHSRPDLRKTVYRMDAFNRLIELDAWGLDLPLVVRGAEISPLTLAGLPPGTYVGPQPGTSELSFLTSQSLTRGLDVRLLQLALSERGADIRADGVFGRASATCVASHQQSLGLPVTGVADPALVLSLASEVTTIN